MPVRFLSADDVAALLTPADCLAAVADAFRAWASGSAPAPGVLAVHVDGGGFHTKVAAMVVGGRPYFAAKTNGNFPGNPERRRLPSIQGLMVLSDAVTGTPLAVLDSGRITELRTAAATAVAARHLAREDARTVALVGCGAQAASQLRALMLVRPLERVLVLDRDPNRAERLARRMSTELGTTVQVAVDLEQAVRETDMCVTCTTSTAPLLMRHMVRPGAFIAAVGADHPHKQEIDAQLLAASKVVVDSLDQCATIGDLHHALLAGLMEPDDVHAELGRVVAGLAPGREREDEVIVFDSTGVALQDVAAAAIAYERAQADGRGTVMELAAASDEG